MKKILIVILILLAIIVAVGIVLFQSRDPNLSPLSKFNANEMKKLSAASEPVSGFSFNPRELSELAQEVSFEKAKLLAISGVSPNPILNIRIVASARENAEERKAICNLINPELCNDRYFTNNKKSCLDNIEIQKRECPIYSIMLY